MAGRPRRRAQRARSNPLLNDLMAAEAEVARILDNLDRYHRPGDRSHLDKAYTALFKAHSALIRALDYSTPLPPDRR